MLWGSTTWKSSIFHSHPASTVVQWTILIGDNLLFRPELSPSLPSSFLFSRMQTTYPSGGRANNVRLTGIHFLKCQLIFLANTDPQLSRHLLVKSQCLKKITGVGEKNSSLKRNEKAQLIFTLHLIDLHKKESFFHTHSHSKHILSGDLMSDSANYLSLIWVTSQQFDWPWAANLQV